MVVAQFFDYPNRCSIIRPVLSGGDGYSAVDPMWQHDLVPCSLNLEQVTIMLGHGQFCNAVGEISFPPSVDVALGDQILADDGTYRVIQRNGLRDPYGQVVEIMVYLGGV